MTQLRSNVRWPAVILTALILIVVCDAGIEASPTQPPTTRWHTATPEAQGMRSQLLAEMLDTILKNRYPIDSVLVVRRGILVLEAYFHPYTPTLKHPIHSCTKSILSALIGIAIDQGHIKSVDQRLVDFFPGRTIANLDERKRAITLENLLMMASGLDTRDSYMYDWQGLYEMMRSKDWAGHMLDLPMVANPGETFEYSNGVSFLLSAILQKSTGMKTSQFARKHLFEPLGIVNPGWSTSPSGVDIGWGRLSLIPRDMAKFGLLYLNKGRWGDRQIVSADWVETSTKRRIEAQPGGGYGYHWWADPKDSFTAVGYAGQFIRVMPELDMVVVFTSKFPLGDLFVPIELSRKFIIPAATPSISLPADPNQSARLTQLLAQAALAPAHGHIWSSETAGVARNGRFSRTQSPKFTFTYPPGSQKVPTDRPEKVMRMRTPEDVFFSASVMDIPDNLQLADFGPHFIAPVLRTVGSQVRVAAHKRFTLPCGTPAYRTDIRWLWNHRVPLTSMIVAAYKNGHCVYLTAHPMLHPERLAPMVESLAFE